MKMALSGSLPRLTKRDAVILQAMTRAYAGSAKILQLSADRIREALAWTTALKGRAEIVITPVSPDDGVKYVGKTGSFVTLEDIEVLEETLNGKKVAN